MSQSATELKSRPALERESAAAGAPVRGQLQRILAEARARVGARVGFAWIAILAVLAVFAPFIANSHPIAVNVDGAWSSPVLDHLTWVDVALLAAFFSGLVALLMRRVPLDRRLAIVASVTLIASIISGLALDPPKHVVWEKYREAYVAGDIDEMLLTPVPFSPSDRSRDNPAALEAPSSAHLMGTDRNGSDLLASMIHASRVALGIGFVATGLALIVGILYGGIMGFFAGWIDVLMMRFLEIFQSIPQLILLLAVVAFFRDAVAPSEFIYLIMVVIGLTSWPGYARYLRAEFLKLRKQDFVQAAIACGLPVRSILFRHMLPNGIAPLLVAASFGIAQAILAEAVLSFLGLGVVGEPSWGGMLNQAVGPGGTFTWWMATYPGFAIFLTVFAYNLLGEALRDAIDPHLKKAAA